MGEALKAILILTDLISAATTLLTQAKKVSEIVSKAKSEQRDISDAEWLEITSADDEAKKLLEDAIKAKSG